MRTFRLECHDGPLRPVQRPGTKAHADTGFVGLMHVVDATIGVPEMAYAAVLLGAGSLFAVAPSLPTLRVPMSRLLRAA